MSIVLQSGYIVIKGQIYVWRDVCYRMNEIEASVKRFSGGCLFDKNFEK